MRLSVRFLVVSIFTCLFSLTALAATIEPGREQTLYVYNSVGGATLVQYASDGIWILETFTESAQTLPFKTGRWVFDTKSQSDEFLKKLAGVWILQPLPWQSKDSEFKTEVASQVLWPTENQWDWNWEIQYAAWVRANLHQKFFSDFKVATDCADVAIATRWIFARIHKLPVGQTVGGNGNVLFTNESFRAEWVGLKRHGDWDKDLVFRKALDYVLNHSYTHTLLRDSYPVAMDPRGFIEGGYHLAIHSDSGHTQLFVEVNSSDKSRLPLYALASTVPRAVRDLYRYPFFDSEQPVLNEGGILRMRWPMKVNGVTRLVGASQMPNYSLEQYDPDFIKDTPNFSLAVYKRINPSFDPVLRVKESVENLVGLIAARKTEVENGYAFCSKNDCTPGTANYENWSTPSRDKRLGTFISDLEVYVAEISNYFPMARFEWENAKKQEVLTIGAYEYLISSVVLDWKLKLFNSDPRVSVEERWALSPAVFAAKVASLLRTAFAEREAALAANLCAGVAACEVVSAAYRQHQTFDLDARLRDLSASVVAYCPNNAARACADFNAELPKHKFTIGNTVVPLAEMPVFSFWLNSDPRHQNDVRRGALAGSHLTRQFESVFNVYESDNGLVLISTQSALHLTDLNLNTIWEAPRSFSEMSFNSESGLVALYNAGEILVRDAKGGSAAVSVPINETPLLRWTGPDILLVSSNDTPSSQTILRFTSTGRTPSLSILATVNRYSESYGDVFLDDRKTALLTEYEGSGVNASASYYNLRTGEKRAIAITPPPENIESVFAHTEVSGRVLISYFDASRNSVVAGWMPVAGGGFALLAENFLGLRVLSEDTLLVQVADGEEMKVTALHLNVDGSVRARSPAGEAFSYGRVRNGYFSVISNGADSVRHFEANGRMTSFDIGANEFLFSYPNPYIFIMNMLAQITVVEQSTGRKLLEGVRFLGGDNVSMPFVLIGPNLNETWAHYVRADAGPLPLLTMKLPRDIFGAYMVSDENVGRFKAITLPNSTTSFVFKMF